MSFLEGKKYEISCTGGGEWRVAFWDIEPCSVADETDVSEVMAMNRPLMTKEVRASETSVYYETTPPYIP
jgi:hypothetical protein